MAPDQRGYGQTDRPKAIEAYDMFQEMGMDYWLRLTQEVLARVEGDES